MAGRSTGGGGVDTPYDRLLGDPVSWSEVLELRLGIAPLTWDIRCGRPADHGDTKGRTFQDCRSCPAPGESDTKPPLPREIRLPVIDLRR